MKRSAFLRRSRTSIALTPEDRAAVDAFREHRAAITALRAPEPWTPRRDQSIAVRVGPFNVSDHQLFADPYEANAVALLDAAVAEVSA